MMSDPTRTPQAIASDRQRTILWATERAQAESLGDTAHADYLGRALTVVTARLFSDRSDTDDV